MKKIIILFILLLALSLSLSAEYVTATITSSDVRNDISFLNKNHIDVDKVKGNQIYLYLFDDDIALLEANGYLITITPNLAKEYADQLWEETKNTRDPMRDYYSLAEYETFMQNTANSYPNICELVDIGDTVDGNDILFMKISDNVMTDENEPEVRYISSIHGDEVVGFDCLIRLIDLLTSDYGTDTRITDIVNSTELWINPMFNPDGYLNHERYNSNGVDLNRNFPTPAGVQHPDGNTWQPETQTIMNWSEGHYFTSSLMFHGGATVMNYPWDYTPVLAPDDLLLQEMALSYAEPYTAMYNSSEFTDGITNGNAWYEIQGSIQDWSYGLTNCFDITAELYDTKWPNSSLLESLWNQNEESLLAYIEFAQNGVRGVVRDEERFPLEAVITVSGNSKTITTHPTTGDYHRLLLPGTYTMTATLDGYRSQTITDIVVPANGNITVNFELQEAQMISFDGILRYADGSLFAGGQINFDAQNIYTVANDGTFSASLMQGEYETLAVDGVAFYYLDISLWESPENACFVFGGEQDLLSDNFEAGLTQWQSTGSWGIENSNGSNTLSDSPSGDYNNDTNTYARIASPLSLNNASATLSFDMYYDLESGYDYGYLEVSSNGTNWEELDSYNGTQNWQEFSYNITGFDNFYFRFRIYTDGGVVDDGMKIDNIALTVANPIHGDFDGDNVLTNTDLDLIADYALNGSTPWDITDIAYADLDDDGEITYIDAGLFRRYLRGTIGQLP
ncbi:MAG: M14 family zinc carboxypeptidase, partial [Candidatus Zophobacter franzmannii]|nr:M14 family zinc carboxypeptidase [Candidatus Zophobacter franzmannii]